ncbi:hypothetical protein EAG_14385, partial [Camponotus floridanus]
YIYIYIHTY